MDNFACNILAARALIKAVEVLDDILQRMQAHQNKKRSMLRPLGVAKGFDG